MLLANFHLPVNVSSYDGGGEIVLGGVVVVAAVAAKVAFTCSAFAATDFSVFAAAEVSVAPCDVVGFGLQPAVSCDRRRRCCARTSSWRFVSVWPPLLVGILGRECAIFDDAYLLSGFISIVVFPKSYQCFKWTTPSASLVSCGCIGWIMHLWWFLWTTWPSLMTFVSQICPRRCSQKSVAKLMIVSLYNPLSW